MFPWEFSEKNLGCCQNHKISYLNYQRKAIHFCGNGLMWHVCPTTNGLCHNFIIMFQVLLKILLPNLASWALMLWTVALNWLMFTLTWSHVTCPTWVPVNIITCLRCMTSFCTWPQGFATSQSTCSSWSLPSGIAIIQCECLAFIQFRFFSVGVWFKGKYLFLTPTEKIKTVWNGMTSSGAIVDHTYFLTRKIVVSILWDIASSFNG